MTLPEQYDEAMFAFSQGEFDRGVAGLQAATGRTIRPRLTPNSRWAWRITGWAIIPRAIAKGHKAEQPGAPRTIGPHQSLAVLPRRRATRARAGASRPPRPASPTGARKNPGRPGRGDRRPFTPPDPPRAPTRSCRSPNQPSPAGNQSGCPTNSRTNLGRKNRRPHEKFPTNWPWNASTKPTTTIKVSAAVKKRTWRNWIPNTPRRSPNGRSP